MVSVRACLLLLCLVSGSSSYNYPAWPGQLEDQRVNVADGDAPERNLFLPMIVQGMLSAVGLDAVEVVLSGTVHLLTGPIGDAVVKFARILLSPFGPLTSDGERVARHLHTPEHRHHMARVATEDVQDLLGVKFTQAQIAQATEHMGNHIQEEAMRWVHWWGNGMQNKYVGRQTLTPMKKLTKSDVQGLSLDVGRVAPVVPTAITWKTYPLPVMCSLALLGGSIAAAMRMCRQTKAMPRSERSFEGVVDDAAFVE